TVAERNFGLFDRRRKHDIEADHRGAAVDDGGEHLADLSRPGYRRRTGEWRRAISLFIERYDYRARLWRAVPAVVESPAQPGENVDRQPVEPIERRRQDQRGGDERNGENGKCIPKPSRYGDHARNSLRLAARLEAGQAADERRIACLGVRIDFEHDRL